MTTITYTAHAVGSAECWEKPHPTRAPVLLDDRSLKTYLETGWVKIGKASITVEYADPMAVEKQRLESLNAELAATLARHQMEKNAIEDRISKLTALTYDAETA